MIITTELSTIAYWFFPLSYLGISSVGLIPCTQIDITNLTWIQKILGFFINSILTSLLICGLILVIQLMKRIQRNEYFSLNNISKLRMITKIALVYAIYTPICSSILSVILSLNNVPGERVITLTIGSAEILNILIFCFMFLIMTMFQRGYELKHEQELTI